MMLGKCQARGFVSTTANVQVRWSRLISEITWRSFTGSDRGESPALLTAAIIVSLCRIFSYSSYRIRFFFFLRTFTLSLSFFLLPLHLLFSLALFFQLIST